MSARPASDCFSSAMTLPIAGAPVTPCAATSGQRGVDGGGHFLRRGGLRQEFLQHGQLGLFLLGGLGAAGLLEGGDGLAALLDLLFDDGGDLCVVQVAAFVHFLLLDGGQQESQRGQAFRRPWRAWLP